MSLATIRQRDPVAAFAISRTLQLEGGFVDDGADPGGATNRGVSLRFALAEAKVDPALAQLFDIDHDGDIDRADIAGLTQDEAADIFDACFWRPGWYRQVSPDLLAWKCFDISVNTGPKRAAMVLQQGLVALGARISVDGQVGPATILAAHARTQRDNGAALLAEIRTAQAVFYRSLVAREPKLRTFLAGWLNRAAA